MKFCLSLGDQTFCKDKKKSLFKSQFVSIQRVSCNKKKIALKSDASEVTSQVCHLALMWPLSKWLQLSELSFLTCKIRIHWRSGKESICQYRRGGRCGFNPWARKIPWRRKWQPAPIFLPGKSHGQRSLVGYPSIWLQTVGHNWVHTHARTILQACGGRNVIWHSKHLTAFLA